MIGLSQAFQGVGESSIQEDKEKEDTDDKEKEKKNAKDVTSVFENASRILTRVLSGDFIYDLLPHMKST